MQHFDKKISSMQPAVHRLDNGADSVEGGNFWGSLGNIGKTVAKAVGPTLVQQGVSMVGGPVAGKVAGDMAKAGLSGLGVRKFQKGSEEAKAHMARIRGMKKGKGFFDIAKSVAKAAAPTLIQAGSKMATDALIKQVGSGVYKEVRHRKIKFPTAKPRAIKKVIHPRLFPKDRILINGIDQVIGSEGGSFASWGYAQ